MARFKDFGSPKSEKESPTFKLHGEEFVAVPEIQGVTLMSFVEAASSENTAEAASLTVKFFEEVLEEESLERFRKLTKSKTKNVSVETLADIVTWLIEEYSQRPEEQREV